MISKVDVVILGFLAEEPMYGYELIERFRDRGMTSWAEIGKASVYQALRRLEQHGLVSGKSQEGAEGPDRRVFRITRAGRDRLREGLAERFAGADPYETDAGLALGFVHLMPGEDARRGIASRERALDTRSKALAAERARVAADRGPGWAAAARLLDLQEAFARAELAWLAAFKRDLAKLRR